MKSVAGLKESEKYCVTSKFVSNEHNTFVYQSHDGVHKIDLPSILEEFHEQQSEEALGLINDLEAKVSELEDQLDEKDRLDEEMGSLQQEVNDYSKIAEGLIPETLIDQQKLEVLRRLYKNCDLDVLEQIENTQKLICKKLHRTYQDF